MINCSIVTYKSPIKILIKAINSALDSTVLNRFYIVDNSPTRELEEKIPLDSRVEYIYTNDNRGFGAGHNIALKKSVEEGVKYHLVLNPDAYFSLGTLEVIKDYMDNNKEVGNLMPKVLYPDGTFQNLCKLLPTPYDWIGRRFNPLKGMVEKRNRIFELHDADKDSIQKIPYLSGCFMFLRIETINKVGLFDENIFMYGEETDLGRRIISAGFENVYFPNVEITHEFQKGSHRSMKLTLIGVKSAIYYFNKWGWIFDKERTSINRKALEGLIRKQE